MTEKGSYGCVHFKNICLRWCVRESQVWRNRFSLGELKKHDSSPVLSSSPSYDRHWLCLWGELFWLDDFLWQVCSGILRDQFVTNLFSSIPPNIDPPPLIPGINSSIFTFRFHLIGEILHQRQVYLDKNILSLKLYYKYIWCFETI